MKKVYLISLLAFTVALGGCASSGGGSSSASKPKPVGTYDSGSTLYTLTNLHPDPQRNLLYSTNYLMPALIPVCTKVSAKNKGRSAFIFTANGIEYTYKFNPRSNPEGFDANLKKYFGKTCSKSEISALSSTDQKGIKAGQAYKGMSKKGIITAIGYPNVEAPSTDISGTMWTYHKNRFNRMIVHFDRNWKVAKIVD